MCSSFAISASSAARASTCVGEHLQHGAVARDRRVRIGELRLDDVRGAEREVGARSCVSVASSARLSTMSSSSGHIFCFA